MYIQIKLWTNSLPLWVSARASGHSSRHCCWLNSLRLLWRTRNILLRRCW